VKFSRFAGLGLCAVALAVAPACSTSESDADATSTATATSTALTEAPAAEDAVNRIGIDPCTLLTAAEAQDAVGFAPLTPSRQVPPDKEGASCDWLPPDNAPAGMIGVVIGVPGRLPDSAPQKIAGVDVVLTESPDRCFAHGRFEDGRGLFLLVSPSVEEVAAAGLDPDVTWCTQAVPTLEKMLTRLGWK